MYFRNDGLAKRLLGKYLKSAVSQYPLRSNMVNAFKPIQSHYGGTFIILIDHQ